MTTKHYHRPLSREDEASILIFNQRFSQLDRAITTLRATTVRYIVGIAGDNLVHHSFPCLAYLDRSDNRVRYMDADSASPPQAGDIRGFVVGGAFSENPAYITISGVIGGFSGLTPWMPLYVGTVAGAYTQTKPVPSLGGSQVFVAEMGFAISDTEVYVYPKPIQYMTRNVMAEDDTLTIVHQSDGIGYQRQLLAYVTEVITGSSIESYSDSNQDSDVHLEDNTAPSYTADLCNGGTASASDENTPSSRAFANDGFSGVSSWQGDFVSGLWLKYDFGAGNEVKARRYTLQATAAPNDSPEAWTFEGSNDDFNWTTLDTQSGVAIWGSGEIRTYDFSNPIYYRYVRWVFTDNHGSAFLSINEAEVMEALSAEYDKLAQTFTLAGTETIGQVGLWLKKIGSPLGPATVRIETVSGGNPTGTLAHANASVTFAESILGTSYADKLLVFASSFSLNADTYALVLSTSRAASSTDYIAWGADESSPSYAGGEMKGQVSGVWSNLGKDAIFSILEVPGFHPERIKVGYWDSTHADMVNRYGDADGDDSDTKTTFKCSRAEGFDDVTVAVILD